MAVTHRTLDGSWAACGEGDECALLFHIELSVEEAAAIPDVLFEQLVEASDPPQSQGSRWVERDYQLRSWLDEKMRPHRDYDLPATIRGDGRRMWFRHGQQHRDGGKPARVDPDGHKEWWVDGRPHRADGPAVIEADGTSAWFWQGRFIKYDPDNREERFHFTKKEQADGRAEWERIMRQA